jgi:hypothetical protein
MRGIVSQRSDLMFMPSPTEKLLNPRTGSEIFALVPSIIRYGFPQAPVFLFFGRRSFGAAHIWDRHSIEMSRKGFDHFHQVPDFVSTIVKPSGPLHFEGSFMRDRLAVVQSASGTAILELFTPPNASPYYSVVTAYLGFKRHGPRIGQLL